jgi:hypothetical protein
MKQWERQAEKSYAYMIRQANKLYAHHRDHSLKGEISCKHIIGCESEAPAIQPPGAREERSLVCLVGGVEINHDMHGVGDDIWHRRITRNKAHNSLAGSILDELLGDFGREAFGCHTTDSPFNNHRLNIT